MNGVQIEYLLGLYFIVISLSYSENRLSANFVTLVAGLLFLVMAVIGKSLI